MYIARMRFSMLPDKIFEEITGCKVKYEDTNIRRLYYNIHSHARYYQKIAKCYDKSLNIVVTYYEDTPDSKIRNIIGFMQYGGCA